MDRRARAHTCLVVPALLLATACSSSTPEPEPTTPSSTPPTEAAPTTPPPRSSPSTPIPASPTSDPTPAALDRVARHPSGVTLRLRTIEVVRGGVQIGIRVTNGAGEEAVLAFEPSMVTLVDDTGAGLEFRAPEANPQLRVAPGEELTGDIAFSGALGADATSVTLRMNWQNGQAINADGSTAEITSFAFEDVPLDGDDDPDTTSEPDDRRTTDVAVEQEHPGNVTLAISQVATTGDGIFLTVRVVNGSDDDTSLAIEQELTWLEDDLGNRYALRPPDSNPTLEILSGEQLTGDIAFVGPLEEGATSLTLRTNHLPSGRALNADGPTGESVSFVVEGLPTP